MEKNTEKPGSSLEGGTPVAAAGKLFIYTFGCQMNEYDSLKLRKILEPVYSEAAGVEVADLVLINTCSVRDKPEQKVYSLLGRLKLLKKKKPQLLVGVCGCVAQQEGESLVKRSGVVDFVFGTHNLSLVPKLIEMRKQGFPPQVAVDYRDEWEELPAGLPLDSRISAPVTISRGCNKKCSYCIVPVTRGPEVSRHPDEVLREIKLLVRRGAKEVLLLGQTVNSYGHDLGRDKSFVWLLEQVSAVEGLERIRFTSPHPQELGSDLIDAIASNSRICHHVHLPLQSGADRILKLMRRNYRRERFLEIVSELKIKVPDVAITTDMIIGFPGESEEDFLQTLDMLERVQFDNSFSFIFSPRPGTAAAGMEDGTPPQEKQRRLAIYQKRQEEIAGTRLVTWIGKTVEVLVEGPSTADPGCFCGRTTQNVMVNLEKSDFNIVPGMTVRAEIMAANRFTLAGSFAGCAKLQ